MTGHLAALAALAVGQARRVEPRLPSLFEPLEDGDLAWGEESSERVVSPRTRAAGAAALSPAATEVHLSAPPADAPTPRPGPVAPGGASSPAPAAIGSVAPTPAAASEQPAPDDGRSDRPLQPSISVTVRAAAPTSPPAAVGPPAPPASDRAVAPRRVPPQPASARPAPVRAAAPPPALARAARDRTVHREQPAPAPTVSVHIARLEVRAVQPQAVPRPPAPAPRPATSAPDLQAYLDGAPGRGAT